MASRLRRHVQYCTGYEIARTITRINDIAAYTLDCLEGKANPLSKSTPALHICLGLPHYARDQAMLAVYSLKTAGAYLHVPRYPSARDGGAQRTPATLGPAPLSAMACLDRWRRIMKVAQQRAINSDHASNHPRLVRLLCH